MRPPSMPIVGIHGGSASRSLLQRLEEIVGPVDLVDLAGLGMADDEPGAVDAEWHFAVLADDPFRVVLGAEVGVVEVLGLLEHVLAEDAVVEARRCDRAHVVEAAGIDRGGEVDGVTRTLDIGRFLLLGARREVVDRRQVEEVLDLALELAQVRSGNAELGLRQVADDADDLLVGRAPVVRAEQRRASSASPCARARKSVPRASGDWRRGNGR